MATNRKKQDRPYRSSDKRFEPQTPIGKPSEGGPWFPVQKKVLWMLRENYDLNLLRKHRQPWEVSLLALVYVSLCELFNNNLEKPLNPSKDGKVRIANILKSLVTMTGARRQNLIWAIRVLRAMELIDYPDRRTRDKGSWLVLYQFVSNERHMNRLIFNSGEKKLNLLGYGPSLRANLRNPRKRKARKRLE